MTGNIIQLIGISLLLASQATAPPACGVYEAPDGKGRFSVKQVTDAGDLGVVLKVAVSGRGMFRIILVSGNEIPYRWGVGSCVCGKPLNFETAVTVSPSEQWIHARDGKWRNEPILLWIGTIREGKALPGAGAGRVAQRSVESCLM